MRKHNFSRTEQRKRALRDRLAEQPARKGEGDGGRKSQFNTTGAELYAKA